MRQADTKFTDMSPRGREVFRQAVESEKRHIRERVLSRPNEDARQ